MVAVRGAEHRGWDLHAHLLAVLVDAVNGTSHTVAQVNSKKRLKRPEALPRPGTKPRDRAGRISVAALAARQQQLRT